MKANPFTLAISAWAVALVLPLAGQAADNEQATSLFESAKQRFETKRADLKVVQALQSDLEKAESLADDSELKYQIKVLASRTYYWQAVNIPGDEENNPAKVPVFEKGYQKAKEAYEISSDYADAYYYYAINLSRYGLAKGKLASLNRVSELKNHLNLAMARPTYDTGDDGVTIDLQGPYRVYGRMYFSLPGIVGGDMNKSKEYLEKAYAAAPNHMLNVIYLAETLADSRSTRAQAKELLADAIRQYEAAPAEYCPERIPETALEILDAKALLKKL